VIKVPCHVERAIIFAEKPGYRALELDLYRPAGRTAAEQTAPRPLMLYVHGGGWRVSGRQRAPRETRAWTRSFWERMVDAGFVVAANDYRFSSEALFPAAVEDTVDALAFLRANASTYGIDASRVVVFGASAGGYLATAVGLGTATEQVQGVIAWYPLTDFSAFADDSVAAVFPAQFLGGPLSAVPTLVEQARVPRLARADAPPVLLQHGTADTMAPFDQSVRLRDALHNAGAAVELEKVEGADHFFGGSSDDEVQQIFERAMNFARRCVSC
jgi:acetyl esterase/lipase